MSNPWQNPNQPGENQQQQSLNNSSAPGQIEGPDDDGISVAKTALMLLAALVLFMVLVAIIPFFVQALGAGIEFIRSFFSPSHGPLFYDKDYRLGAFAMVLIGTVAVVIAAIRRR